MSRRFRTAKLLRIEGCRGPAVERFLLFARRADQTAGRAGDEATLVPPNHLLLQSADVPHQRLDVVITQTLSGLHFDFAFVVFDALFDRLEGLLILGVARCQQTGDAHISAEVQKLISDAGCPVLIVPPEWSRNSRGG